MIGRNSGPITSSANSPFACNSANRRTSSRKRRSPLSKSRSLLKNRRLYRYPDISSVIDYLFRFLIIASTETVERFVEVKASREGKFGNDSLLEMRKETRRLRCFWNFYSGGFYRSRSSLLPLRFAELQHTPRASGGVESSGELRRLFDDGKSGRETHPVVADDALERFQHGRPFGR